MPNERSQIADSLGVKTFKQDEIIFKQGDQGESLYFIEQGLAEVCKTLKNDSLELINERARLNEIKDQTALNKLPEIHLRTLSKGCYFGERALLTDEPRSATVRASTPCNCLLIHRDVFERLFGTLKHRMVDHFKDYKDLK